MSSDFDIKSAKEAADNLFQEMLPQISPSNKKTIQTDFLSFKENWGSLRLFKSNRDSLYKVVLSCLEKSMQEHGFDHFSVDITYGRRAQIITWSAGTGSSLTLWRSNDGIFFCGNRDFESWAYVNEIQLNPGITEASLKNKSKKNTSIPEKSLKKSNTASSYIIGFTANIIFLVFIITGMILISEYSNESTPFYMTLGFFLLILLPSALYFYYMYRTCREQNMNYFQLAFNRKFIFYFGESIKNSIKKND